MHLHGGFGYKKQFQKHQENTGHRDSGCSGVSDEVIQKRPWSMDQD